MKPIRIQPATSFPFAPAATDLLYEQGMLLPFTLGRRRVPFCQIVRLEGVGNYTLFVFTDNTRLIVALTLKRLTARLPVGLFLRPHRKHLLNLTHLNSIDQIRYVADMSNGDCVAVSRRKAAGFCREVRQRIAALV